MRTQREVLRAQICCHYQKYPTLATYNVKYKEDNPDLHKRLAESSRARTKHKGKVRKHLPFFSLPCLSLGLILQVPIICERDINASGNCPTCSKQKFLVEERLTCGKFILAIQKQLTHAAKLYIRVAHSEGSFVYPSLFTMGEMDRELRDQDGYLYVVYSDIPPEPAQPKLLLERSIVSSGQLLVRFARLGDNTEAFRLIVAGVPLDCEDALGMTAVFWSASSGNAALVDTLVDAGAELDVRSKAGHTALMGACSEGHIEIAKALLNAGAHQDLRSIRISSEMAEALACHLTGAHLSTYSGNRNAVKFTIVCLGIVSFVHFIMMRCI